MVQSQNRFSPVTAAMSGMAGRAAVLPPVRPDRRADGQVRSVSLSREMVRIDRRLQGIAMRVTVPVRAYRGVALSLQPDASGRLSYRLDLLHHDGELSVALGEAADDAEIVADWRLWSRFFRLPALVERQAGLIEEADLTLGAVVLAGTSLSRRKPRSVSRRRPRFLQRRKPGSALAEAPVFTGREIIARD